MSRLVAVIDAALLVLGILVGIAIGTASTPRSAQHGPSDTGLSASRETEPALRPAMTLAGRAGAPSVVGASHVPTTPVPAASSAAGPVVVGIASWYAAGPGLYVALPGPWRSGRRVLVCGPDARCWPAPVVTSCGCPGGRIVDLSVDLFRHLAPLSQGLVRVTLEVFG